MSSGSDVLAAQAIGADLAYMGTRFIATEEANAVPGYKEMLVESKAQDIVYSSLFTGVHGSYLKSSIRNAGMDPDNLPEGDKAAMDFGKADKSEAKVWKDIWGAGQGVGDIDEIIPVEDLVMRMEREYIAARKRLGID